jgi:hypothetical protein
VSVEEFPTQIDKLDALAITVGLGVTVTVTVWVEEQPDPFAPVTVYVVFIVGDTRATEPVTLIGCHV